jgi:hypothetical protein
VMQLCISLELRIIGAIARGWLPWGVRNTPLARRRLCRSDGRVHD